jgi:hypothetical protein
LPAHHVGDARRMEQGKHQQQRARNRHGSCLAQVRAPGRISRGIDHARGGERLAPRSICRRRGIAQHRASHCHRSVENSGHSTPGYVGYVRQGSSDTAGRRAPRGSGGPRRGSSGSTVSKSVCVARESAHHVPAEAVPRRGDGKCLDLLGIRAGHLLGQSRRNYI